ncbi:asparagine synthase (glutamine-hydrolyzing) [Crenothrix sp.]|uniref:asparagine synthase (glutamine-hydrolyzing) n=1 Tax=Crenothrix sp. TaxID=3100433 RepID=UPI00374DB18D
MCGLTGFWQTTHFSTDTAYAVAEQMAQRIIHRGPDDAGVWVDESSGVALAHRRLAIVDLSPAGHQPMLSTSGRYVLVFNGEIYNHLSLREELDKINVGQWRGHSDTETLLAAFESWDIETTLQKTVGMFAIALWDRQEKILTLARDRMGEKPLYYGFQNNTFMFASELKALKAHPDFVGEIDRDVMCLYLRHCCIPAPYSIYKGIKKLLPGTFLQLPLTQNANHLSLITPKPYWCLKDAVEKGLAQPFVGPDSDAIVALDAQLKQSIGLQMMADVPLGAFLSGGIDSSTIVALMQAQSNRPVKTFSIGFTEAGYNEAEYAKAVAQHLGTEHTELYVSSDDSIQVIPKLANMFDEPFADSSQIPTFLVAQMARKHVTVSLSGDAGDELFCGYNRYLLADQWHKVSKIPFGVRQTTGRIINKVAPETWEGVFKQLSKIVALPNNMGQKLEKMASRLETSDRVEDLYYSLVSEISHPEHALIHAKEPASWLARTGLGMSFTDAKLHMMYMDSMTYLTDDILVKVDRAAMAVSLETRVPFLDHNVIELAWSLPLSMKFHEGQTKWLLRQVLYQYVPKQLIERPKAGFGIPLGQWLRGSLREWAEGLLHETRLREEGFFNVSFVRQLWQEHLSGKHNWQILLWNILMFQAWLEGEQAC